MITENYIKMCEKAEEIQKEYKECKMGDYIYDLNHTWFSLFIWHEGLNNYIWRWVQETIEEKKGLPEEKHHLLTTNYIWLPTQEQLQEMVNIKDGKDFEGFCVDIGFLCVVPYGKDYCGFEDYYRKSDSINELMLKYVMNFKYNKVWNGKTWVAV